MTLLQLPRPESVEDLRAYVYRIAANLAARRGETALNQQRIRQTLACGQEEFDTSPEPALSEEQQLLRLQKIFNKLPPRERLAVRLRFWDELSFAEIVARFRARGIIVGERTVKRYVAEALARCRELMESESPSINP